MAGAVSAGLLSSGALVQEYPPHVLRAARLHWQWLAVAGAVAIVVIGAAVTGGVLLRPAAAEPTAAAVADLDPTTVPWYDAVRPLDNAGPRESYELDAGLLGDDAPRISKTIDLVTASEELERSRAMPVAVLPDGALLYASDDGTASTLHLGSVANREEREVAQVPGLVWAVGLAPDASVAYVSQLDRVTEQDAGVWAIATDGSGQARRVMPPARAGVAHADFSLVAMAAYTASLRLDVSGRMLTRSSCDRDNQPFACTLDVLDLSTGKITRLDDALGAGFIGLEDGLVLTQPTCFGDDPCGPVVVDLASGARQGLPWVTDAAGITLAGRSPVVVAVSHADAELSGVAVIDLQAHRTRQLIAERPASIILWHDGSAVLPPGWLHADIDSGDQQVRLAVRVSDGKTVQLPLTPPVEREGVSQNG